MYLSRTDTFAKLFFIISFIGLFFYIILAFYTFHSAYLSLHQTMKNQRKIKSYHDPDLAPLKNERFQTMKYILLWKMYDTENPIGEGQEPFIKYDCLHKNCYLTTDREYLDDYTSFHAVVFNASDLKRWNRTLLPSRRSWDQKYVFFSKLSAEEAPICNAQADNFFNWTWTYKLYSDILSPFFEVRDMKDDVVAPRFDVVWQTNIYEPIYMIQFKNLTKSKAMATFWKNCGSVRSQRVLRTTQMLRKDLMAGNLEFDIFGCGNNSCHEECPKVLERDYFYYYVYDTSFSEDYVTDEVVTAFEADTVPVLSGLTDYSRFLPPGSYINCREKSPETLAAVLNYAINNLPIYLSYSRWKKHYTVHRTPPYQGLCELCSHLNNPVLMERRNNYVMFRRWWYPGPLNKRCIAILKNPPQPGLYTPKPDQIPDELINAY